MFLEYVIYSDIVAWTAISHVISHLESYFHLSILDKHL